MRITLLAIALVASLVVPAAASQGAAPQPFAPLSLPKGVDLEDVTLAPNGRTVYGTLVKSRRRLCTIIEWQMGSRSYRVVPFSGKWRDLEEVLTADGKAMIFASNRPIAPGGKPLDSYYEKHFGPARGGNLWIVHRSRSGWGEPQRLPDAINANTSTFTPAVDARGTLYFMRATGRDGEFHLFMSRLENGTYRSAVPAPFGDMRYPDFDPAVAADGSFIIFSSARPPAKGGAMLISYNRNGTWTKPVELGKVIDGVGSGGEARISPDLRTLFFTGAHGLMRAQLPAGAGTT